MKLLLSLLLFFATVGGVFADGGTVQVSREEGPFRVTIFTTSAVVRAGPEDVSVLVQDRGTQQPLLNATVRLSFRRLDQQPAVEGEAWVPPCCRMKPQGDLAGMEATHKMATNKLLYAATPTLPTAGEWEVRAEVRIADVTVSVAGPLRVEPPAPPILVYWPFFFLPVVSIAGYMLHSQLRSPRKHAKKP